MQKIIVPYLKVAFARSTQRAISYVLKGILKDLDYNGQKFVDT